MSCDTAEATYVAADVERRLALSRSLEAADAIVVVSDYMRALLHDAQPHLDARLHRLSRPIRDLGNMRPRHRTRPEDPAVVIYAGRITAEKGLAVVIEALGATQHDAPVELRIAGVMEDQRYWLHCQQLQAAAMARNPDLTITYLGHVDYDAIDEQFRQSDIVTIPSQWPEPLGAVALEAMSAGAAVIASSVGGLNDTLVHDYNGLHADPGDVESWVKALTTLLQHPELARRLGHQAHRDFASIAIDDHLNDLDDLVSTHRTAPRPHPQPQVSRADRFTTRSTPTSRPRRAVAPVGSSSHAAPSRPSLACCGRSGSDPPAGPTRRPLLSDRRLVRR